MRSRRHRGLNVMGERPRNVLALFLLIALSVAAASPARAQQKTCYSCHKAAAQKYDLKFKHDPVAKENCERCHVRHGFSNSLILKTTGKALCTGCHANFDTALAGLTSIHPAVKEALCTTCHNPHASNRKGLLREVDNDIACFVCHTALADTTSHPKAHVPFAQRDCAACHVAHGGSDPKLLRGTVDDVCKKCHDVPKIGAQHLARGLNTAGLQCVGCHDPHRSTRAALVGDKVHKPVSEGKCNECHTAPAAGSATLGTADSTWTNCQKCHSEIGQKLTGAVPHQPAADGECYQCHVAHRSNRPALLRGGVGELCQTCHEDMALAVLAKEASKHAPVAEGHCQACHDPHGSPNKSLLKLTGDALCVSCHTKDKFANSAHLKKAGVACLDCHLPHTSSQAFLLKQEPAGVCGQCHEPKARAGMAAHEPATRTACSACHDPHGGIGKANLVAEQPSLCFTCHPNIARFVAEQVKHPPTEDCLSCHGAHEAPNKGLLTSKPRELCGGCHDVAIAATNHSVHPPFASGDCAGCHNPHGSAVKSLLGPRRQLEKTPMGEILRYPKVDTTAVSLCQTCHREKIIGWQDQPIIHKPFKDGRCFACHAPHQADAEHLLVKPVNAICQSCHKPTDLKNEAHQGMDFATANCTQCHDPHASDEKALIRAKRHAPFAEGNCEACHEAKGSIKLSEPQPQLCLACHEDLEKQLARPTVHAPAKSGQCTACHGPHTANNDKLLLAKPSALCRRCHDLKPEGNLHAPFAQGECAKCHAPHGSAEPALLVGASRQICLGCHQTLKDRLEKEHPHAALDKGCLTCHDGHSSKSASLLKTRIVDLCVKCHDIKAPQWTSRHQGGGAVQNCVSCHDPHSSPKKTGALLKRSEHTPFVQRTCNVCHVAGAGKAIKGNRELCGRCHAKTLETIDKNPIPHPALADSAGCVVCHSPHTGDTRALLRLTGFSVCLTCHTSIKLTDTKVHPPAAEDCANCHTPHGGNNKQLLSEPDIMTLCQQCHDNITKTHFHPMGTGTKDPNREGPVVCTGCHSPHNSDNAALLLGEPNRGLCVRCHDPSTQHKDQPQGK
jgi:predicted CXXCH cytochrome family protein